MIFYIPRKGGAFPLIMAAKPKDHACGKAAQSLDRVKSQADALDLPSAFGVSGVAAFSRSSLMASRMPFMN